MDEQLIKFIETHLATARYRGLAPVNPIVFRIEKVSTFLVEVGKYEPSFSMRPYNHLWICADSASPYYKKLMRRTGHIKNPSTPDWYYSWEEVVLYEDVFTSTQYYQNYPDAYSVYDMGIGGELPDPATEVYAGIVLTKTSSLTPRALLTTDARLKDARTPTAHSHEDIARTMIRIGGLDESPIYAKIASSAAPVEGDILVIISKDENSSNIYNAEWRSPEIDDIQWTDPRAVSLTIKAPNGSTIGDFSETELKASINFDDGSVITEPTNVIWTVGQNSQGITINEATGVLTAPDLTSQSMVVVHASWYDSTFLKTITGLLTMTINNTYETVILSSLEINGADSVWEEGGSSYTVSAVYSNGTTATVTPLTFTTDDTGVADINLSGSLITYAVNSDNLLTLTATYKEDEVTRTATKVITVKDVVTLDRIELSGASTIAELTRSTYVLTAFYSDGTSSIVSPTSISSSNPTLAPLDGMTLVAGDAGQDLLVTLSASLVVEGVTKVTTFNVTITDETVAPYITGIAIKGATSVASGDVEKYTVEATYSTGTKVDVTPTTFRTVETTLATVSFPNVTYIKAGSPTLIASFNTTDSEGEAVVLNATLAVNVAVATLRFELRGPSVLKEQEGPYTYSMFRIKSDGTEEEYTSISALKVTGNTQASSLYVWSTSASLVIGDITANDTINIGHDSITEGTRTYSVTPISATVEALPVDYSYLEYRLTKSSVEEESSYNGLIEVWLINHATLGDVKLNATEADFSGTVIVGAQDNTDYAVSFVGDAINLVVGKIPSSETVTVSNNLQSLPIYTVGGVDYNTIKTASLGATIIDNSYLEIRGSATTTDNAYSDTYSLWVVDHPTAGTENTGLLTASNLKLTGFGQAIYQPYSTSVAKFTIGNATGNDTVNVGYDKTSVIYKGSTITDIRGKEVLVVDTPLQSHLELRLTQSSVPENATYKGLVELWEVNHPTKGTAKILSYDMSKIAVSNALSTLKYDLVPENGALNVEVKDIVATETVTFSYTGTDGITIDAIKYTAVKPVDLQVVNSAPSTAELRFTGGMDLNDLETTTGKVELWVVNHPDKGTIKVTSLLSSKLTSNNSLLSINSGLTLTAGNVTTTTSAVVSYTGSLTYTGVTYSSVAGLTFSLRDVNDPVPVYSNLTIAGISTIEEGAGKTTNMTASATEASNGTTNVTNDVVWSISGATRGATINSAGKVTFGSTGQGNYSLTIKATLGSLTATKAIAVTEVYVEPEPEPDTGFPLQMRYGEGPWGAGRTDKSNGIEARLFMETYMTTLFDNPIEDGTLIPVPKYPNNSYFSYVAIPKEFGALYFMDEGGYHSQWGGATWDEYDFGADTPLEVTVDGKQWYIYRSDFEGYSRTFTVNVIAE